MAGIWKGPFPLNPNVGFPIDLFPYRHWNSRPGTSDPTDGCPAPPPTGTGPYILAFIDMADPEAGGGEELAVEKAPIKEYPKEILKIPNFYRTLLERPLKSFPGVPFEAAAFVDSNDLDVLAQRIEEFAGERGVSLRGIGHPLPDGVQPNTFSDDPDTTPVVPAGLPFPKKAVIIVDANIPFAHDRLRRAPDRTRLTYFWDQDAAPSVATQVPIGREMYAADIDGYLALLDPAGAGEESLYLRYRAESYGNAPDRARPPNSTSHGAHMIDTAAGFDVTEATFDPDTALFAVSLPNHVLSESHGGYLFAHVKLAIDRCLQQIEAMTTAHNAAHGADEAVPEVFINLSLGGVAGRHDGFSQFEIYLDKLVSVAGVAAVTVAAGNERKQHLHARFSVEEMQKNRAVVDWRIQPDDGTPSFLQIWVPPQRNVNTLTWSFQPPEENGPGLPSNRLDVGVGAQGATPGTYYELVDGCEVLARLYVEDDAWPCPPDFPTGLPRETFTLAVRHTKEDHTRPGYGPGRPDLAGGWRVSVWLADARSMPFLDEGEEVMLWVERDDPFGMSRSNARQSYLEQPAIVPGYQTTFPDLGPGPVSEYGTLNDIGTGTETIIAAAHHERDGRISDYSGRGYRYMFGSTSHVKRPTVSAAADDSEVLFGLIGAGYYSGSVRRFDGTSVATAMVTRHLTGNATGAPPPSGADKTGIIADAAAFEADQVTAPRPEPGWHIRPLPSLTEHGRLGHVKPPRKAN